MGYIPSVFDLHGWKDEEILPPEGWIGLSQGWEAEKFLLPEGWCSLHFHPLVYSS
jgi:hypothetical protein